MDQKDSDLQKLSSPLGRLCQALLLCLLNQGIDHLLMAATFCMSSDVHQEPMGHHGLRYSNHVLPCDMPASPREREYLG